MAISSLPKRSRIANGLISASVWLFFLSLVFPAYLPETGAQSPERYFGIAAFILGPIGLFAGHFSWLANPLLWFAWGRFNKSDEGVALALASISLLVALTFLLGKTVAVGSAGEYPYKVLAGYFIWLASIGSAIVATLVGPAKVETAERVADAS